MFTVRMLAVHCIALVPSGAINCRVLLPRLSHDDEAVQAPNAPVVPR